MFASSSAVRRRGPVRAAAATLAVMLVAVTAAACGSRRASPQPPQESVLQVRFYVRGRVLGPSADPLSPADADQVMRALLARTDNTMRMLVHDALIDRLKQTETAVEFTYPQPVEITAGVMGTVRLDRVFVPLTGEYALDGGAVLAFVGLGGYERIPLEIPGGRGVLAPVLKSLRALDPAALPTPDRS